MHTLSLVMHHAPTANNKLLASSRRRPRVGGVAREHELGGVLEDQEADAVHLSHVGRDARGGAGWGIGVCVGGERSVKAESVCNQNLLFSVARGGEDTPGPALLLRVLEPWYQYQDAYLKRSVCQT